MGMGVDKDVTEAVRLFQLAVAGGSWDGHVRLGYCYTDHWNNFFFFLLYVIFWKRKVLVVPLQ